jgi:hypothetical protein
MKEYASTITKKEARISISNHARKNVEFLSLNSIRIMLADNKISSVVSIRVRICFTATV